MLKKLRKGALTVEFIVIVSILVLIVGLGGSWLVAQYNNAEDNANNVAEVIIKDANGLVGGEQGGSEIPSEPSEPVEMITFTCKYYDIIETFTCPSGFTWGDFLISEYNTSNNFTFDETRIDSTNNFGYCADVFGPYNAVIVDGTVYQ